MKTDPHDYAFPLALSGFSYGDGKSSEQSTVEARGLSIREYFAALALQGLLANATAQEDIGTVIAEDNELHHATAALAVAHADALIVALNAADPFARFRK